MIKELFFGLLLFICLGFQSHVTNAQTSAKQTIPDAFIVILDTIFYTPDKAMPFDRHFTLKLSLPGKIILKGYLVYPIDHYGNRIAARRNYNLYTWSLVKSRAKLRKKRKSVTWENFKDPKNLGAAILKDTATHAVGKRTGIELKIPPLDPNRDYQLKIIYIDPKFGEKIDELILPLVSTLTGNSSLKILTFDQLKTSYDKIGP